jgi:hypothetical protein
MINIDPISEFLYKYRKGKSSKGKAGETKHTHTKSEYFPDSSNQ